MFRTTLAVLFVALGGLAAAPVRPETETERIRRLYGATDDPHDDAAFELVGDKLRISIRSRTGPAEPLFLAHSGARAWRPVGGDFVAVVRVAFPAELTPGTEPDRDGAAVAVAGLVAAADGGDAVTAARVLRFTDGRPAEWLESAWQTADGKGQGHGSGSDAVPPDSAFVRLAREGQRVTTAYSRDGTKWTDLDAYDVGWPERVKVGVIADNGHAARFVATFDRYAVTRPKK